MPVGRLAHALKKAAAAAANAARRKVTVKVNDGADIAIRVGPTATLAANRGLQLSAGQAYTYEGTDAVFARREAAAALDDPQQAAALTAMVSASWEQRFGLVGVG